MRDTEGGALVLLSLMSRALVPRLAAASEVRPDDAVPRSEHESLREQLEAEVRRLTQLLQGALRKQDEMALEAAEAWQKVRDQEMIHGGGGGHTDTSHALPPRHTRHGRAAPSGRPCRSWRRPGRRRTRR